MDKNKEIIQKWVHALRSGKYLQGAGSLRPTRGEYCCLGVLCDIHPDVAWGERPSNCRERFCYFEAEYLSEEDNEFPSSEVEVPDALRDKIGLSSEFQSTLVKLNDDGYSFSIIADRIEQELLRGR